MAGNIEVSVRDDQHVRARLIAAADGFERETGAIARDIAQFARGRAMAHAPRGQTGILGSTIEVGEVTFGRNPIGQFVGEGTAEVSVEAKAPWAPFVEFGTGVWGPEGRYIEAGPGNIFVLWKEGTGPFHQGKYPVFTRRIKGQKANPFMRRAAEESEFYAQEFAQRDIDEYLARHGF